VEAECVADGSDGGGGIGGFDFTGADDDGNGDGFRVRTRFGFLGSLRFPCSAVVPKD